MEALKKLTSHFCLSNGILTTNKWNIYSKRLPVHTKDSTSMNTTSVHASRTTTKELLVFILRISINSILNIWVKN